MKLEPYLLFNGTCEEALNFYAKAIGAKTTYLMRYKETPPDVLKAMQPLPDGWNEKVMHACVVIGETTIMAGDTHAGMCNGRAVGFNGFSLSITAKDAAATKRLVDALAKDGGKITMPVGPTFWGSPAFGMAEDRFGMSWMVSVEMAAK